MNLKDKLINLKDKMLSSEPAVIEEIQNTNLAVLKKIPTVIFEDIKLQIIVGQWLGIIGSVKCERFPGLQIFTSIDAEELLQNTFPLEDLDKICTTFGRLLSEIGISSEETCVLSNFDKTDYSFDCFFTNDNEKGKMSISFGSFIDDSPEFTIDYKNIKRNYEFYSIKDEEFLLNPQKYTIKNPANGNFYERFISKYSVSIKLYNDEYECSLQIEETDDLKYSHPDGFALMLDNETELETALLNLPLPCDINNLFRTILNITGYSYEKIKELGIFKLEQKKKTPGKKDKTIDEVKIKTGSLKKFTKTELGTTLSFDKNGTLSCEIENFSSSVSIDALVNNFSNNEILELIEEEKKKTLRPNN